MTWIHLGTVPLQVVVWSAPNGYVTQFWACPEGIPELATKGLGPGEATAQLGHRLDKLQKEKRT